MRRVVEHLRHAIADSICHYFAEHFEISTTEPDGFNFVVS